MGQNAGLAVVFGGNSCVEKREGGTRERLSKGSDMSAAREKKSDGIKATDPIRRLFSRTAFAFS